MAAPSRERAPTFFSFQETEIFFEVTGKWVTLGDVEVNIGANASAGASRRGEEEMCCLTRLLFVLLRGARGGARVIRQEGG